MRKVLIVLVVLSLLFVSGCEFEEEFQSQILEHDWSQYAVSSDCPEFSAELEDSLSHYNLAEKDEELAKKLQNTYQVLNKFDYAAPNGNYLSIYLAHLQNDIEMGELEPFVNLLSDIIPQEEKILEHLNLKLDFDLIVGDFYDASYGIIFPVIETVTVSNIDLKDISGFEFIPEEKIEKYNNTIAYLKSIEGKCIKVSELIAEKVDMASLDEYEHKLLNRFFDKIEAAALADSEFNLMSLYSMENYLAEDDWLDWDDADNNDWVTDDWADSDHIQIYIDGYLIQSDVAPYLEAGRTMVPLRVISESLHAGVTWHPDTEKVSITREDTEIELFIGKDFYLLNQDQKELDTAPVMKDGRTMVPLRLIAEAFGKTVEWDEWNQSVYIQSPCRV